MNYTYQWHSLAREDYSEAYTWYENRETGLGERFVMSVRHKINEIIQYPEAYGSKDNKSFREAAIEGFPYTIVYKLNKRKRQIFISAIYHTKRDPKYKYRK